MKLSINLLVTAGLTLTQLTQSTPLERRLFGGGGNGPNIQFPESFGKTGGAWFANPFQVFLNMLGGKGVGKSIEDSAQFVQFPGPQGGSQQGSNNGQQQGQQQQQPQQQQQQQQQPQQQQQNGDNSGGHQH